MSLPEGRVTRVDTKMSGLSGCLHGKVLGHLLWSKSCGIKLLNVHGLVHFITKEDTNDLYF